MPLDKTELIGALPRLFLLSFSTFVVCVPAAFTQVISFDLMLDMDSFATKEYAWAFPFFVAGECAAMAFSICMLDHYGRKRPYLIGSLLFLAGTALCALSGDMITFIAFRLIQGFGAGIVIVACIAQIYFDIKDKQNRYAANGIMSLGFGGGMLCGIFAGKLALETIGWNEAFWIVFFLQAVITYPALQVFNNGKCSDRPADLPGAIILTVWAGLFVLLLQKIYLDWPLTSPQALMGISGVTLLFLLFVFIELRHKHSVFHRKVDGGKMISGLLIFVVLLGLIDMAAVGYMVKIALFTYRMSVLEAAPYFVILVIGAAVTAIAVTETIDKTGHRFWLLLSAVLSPIALLSMLLVSPEDHSVIFAAHLFILGLAIGCLVSMLNAAIQNRLDEHNNGAVMSFAIMMRTVALWLGYNFYQLVSDGYMSQKIGDIIDHWNSVLPFDLPSTSALANLLITPLGDALRLLPGISDDIATYFAEGVGEAMIYGAVAFPLVAIPVAFVLIKKERVL